MTRVAVRDIGDDLWRELVAGSSSATPFHDPAWAQTVAEAYGVEAEALLVLDAGRAVAGLPVIATRRPLGRAPVALPYTDRLQPLGGEEAVGELLAWARARYAPRALEIRADVGALADRRREVGVRHALPLGDGEAAACARFGSQARRGVARAARDDVRVRVSRSADDLEIFYRLHVRTRRRQGVPVQPRRFFGVLHAMMIRPSLGAVLVAEVAGRPAAAAVFLVAGGTAVYKFGASDPPMLPHRPNHAIFAEAIRWAIAAGATSLDFGRTETGNAGLASFKRSWGAIEAPLVYSWLNGSERAGRPGSGWVADAAGAVIRRTPEAVCRLAGRALYRYAG